MRDPLSPCSGPEDQFVSLSVSEDSGDNVAVSCFEMSKSVLEKGNLPDPESLSELVEFPIPKPMSSFEVRDLKQALMGDHESHFISDKALLGVPSPKALLSKLKRANLRRQREIRVGGYRLWPFLLLSVKAEINPLLTTTEVLCTFIVLVSWLNTVILGATGVPIVGGIALFVALNILHYWYGFSRYHSFQGDWYADMMTGKALDQNFEQTRDICSNQCHGDMERRSQTGVLLFTAPFTIFNHVASLAAYGVYKLLRLNRKSKSGPDSPALALIWGTCFTNIAFTVMVMFGGPFLMTFAVLNFIINQRLYNAMLFRRNFEGFMISFLLGNFLVGELKATKEASAATKKALEESDSSLIGENLLSMSTTRKENGSRLDKIKSRDNLFEDIEEMRSRSYDLGEIDQMSSASKDDEFSTFTPESRQTLQTSNTTSLHSKNSQLSETSTNMNTNTLRKLASAAMWVGAAATTTSSDQSSPDPSSHGKAEEVMDIEISSTLDSSHADEDVSSIDLAPASPKKRKLQNKESSLFFPDTSDEDDEEDDDEASTLDRSDVIEELDKAPEVPTMNFLNNVYLYSGDGRSPLDSHPGTLVWKNAIRGATEAFSCSPFGDRQHDWVVKKLETRDVFAGTIEHGWTKLNPIQVREKCRDAYEKQIEVDGEIKTILNGLQDLKKAKEKVRAKSFKPLPKEVVLPSLKVAPPARKQEKVRETEKEQEPDAVEVSLHTPEALENNKKNRLGVFLRSIRSNQSKTASKSNIQTTNEEVKVVLPSSIKPSDRDIKTKIPIYLGQKGNVGYQHFVKVVKLAAEDTESVEYTEDIHKWVLPRANAKVFNVKTLTGTFREASDTEVRKHAKKCYSEAKQEIESDKQRRDQFNEIDPIEPSIEITDVVKANDLLKQSSRKASNWKRKFKGLSDQDKGALLNGEESLSSIMGENTPSPLVDKVDSGNDGNDNNWPSSEQDHPTDVKNDDGNHVLGLQAIRSMDEALQYMKNAGEKLFSDNEGEADNRDNEGEADNRDTSTAETTSFKVDDDTRDAAVAVLAASTTNDDATESRDEWHENKDKDTNTTTTSKHHPKIIPLKIYSRDGFDDVPALLDDDQKQNPELVKKWIFTQTRARRNRSKFFGSLWTRARSLRRNQSEQVVLNEEQIREEDEDGEEVDILRQIFSDDEDDETNDDEGNTRPSTLSSKRSWKMNRPRSLRALFTSKSSSQQTEHEVDVLGATTTETDNKRLDDEEHEDVHGEHDECDGKKMNEEDAEQKEASLHPQSFYDIVMVLLTEDYMKSKSEHSRRVGCGGGRGLPTMSSSRDDPSAASFHSYDSSTLSSCDDSMLSRQNEDPQQLPPQSILEFVERKLEEEVLFSRMCIGDSTYSGMQCDAGYEYLKNTERYGCVGSFQQGQCGEWIESAQVCTTTTIGACQPSSAQHEEEDIVVVPPSSSHPEATME